MTWQNSSSSIVHLHTQCDNMQTRIQLTIKDEDKNKLFAKEWELDELVERMITEYVTFPVDVQIYPQEPEAEALDESHFSRVYNDIEVEADQ